MLMLFAPLAAALAALLELLAEMGAAIEWKAAEIKAMA
jgi:hypothetical protein